MPRNMQRRDFEAEINNMRKSCKKLQEIANDKNAWHELATGLCPNWVLKRHKRKDDNKSK
uniref:Uncharacterized protein n=1 Tax=Arion vulgaris TaxID=1028688 RepID=A0A0B6ZYY5_9EUPU